MFTHDEQAVHNDSKLAVVSTASTEFFRDQTVVICI